MSQRTSVIAAVPLNERAGLFERAQCGGNAAVSTRKQPRLRVIPRSAAALSFLLVAAGIAAPAAVLATDVAPERGGVKTGPASAVRDPAVDKKTETPDQIATSGKCSGKCVDENGRPIAEARVRVFFVDFNHCVDFHSPPVQRQLQDVRTDSYGKFSIARVDVKQLKFATVVLVVQSPGKATAFQPTWQNTPMAASYEFKLNGAGRLRGRVTDVHRKPVAGAVVNTVGIFLIEPVPGIACAVTDADGRFEIDDVAKLNFAPNQIQPGLVSWPGGWVRHRDYARQLFMRSLKCDTVNITLQRRADVAGKVVSAKTRKPVAKALVEFRGIEPEFSDDWWTRATTDAQGKYHLEILPPGRYNVTVMVPLRGTRAAAPVKLKVGKNVHNVRIDERPLVNVERGPEAQGGAGAGGGVF